jgi:hypothetical protein
MLGIECQNQAPPCGDKAVNIDDGQQGPDPHPTVLAALPPCFASAACVRS